MSQLLRPHWQGQPMDAHIEDWQGRTRVILASGDWLCDIASNDSHYQLRYQCTPVNTTGALALWLEQQFQRHPQRRAIHIQLDGNDLGLRHSLHSLGGRGDDTVTIRREGFFQQPGLWQRDPVSYPYQGGEVQSQRPKQYLHAHQIVDVSHPRRPEKPRGWVYARYDQEFQRHIAFRAVQPALDLNLFHQWQNDPRVAAFWEMAQSREQLSRYLEQQQGDEHTLGLIGYLNGEPFGYFEAYWCAEDRLGAYYDVHSYDRGWHGLTGSRKHLGRANTLTWIKALCHYLFLDDPRTQRLMGEPRADNVTLLRYSAQVPYEKLGEFDFPHKRAALMQLERANYFRQVVL